MVSKLVALLLALVVSWSGSLAAEQSVTLAMTSAAHVDAESQVDPSTRLPAGTANAHQPDELPAPGHAEAQADLPAILTDGVQMAAPVLVMSRPRPHAALTPLSPDLVGPQRPPCALTHHA